MENLNTNKTNFFHLFMTFVISQNHKIEINLIKCKNKQTFLIDYIIFLLCFADFIILFYKITKLEANFHFRSAYALRFFLIS
jgi:hypothetical protein